MKLLIADSKCIHRCRLPDEGENFYTISVKLFLADTYVNEMITLQKENGYWTLESNDEYVIFKDEKQIKKVTFNNYLSFDIAFKNYPSRCSIYVVANKLDYQAFAVKDLNNITIGSVEGCLLFCAALHEQAAIIEKQNGIAFIYKTGNNNVYINSTAVSKSRINIGDNIFIGSVHIIYMKDIILVSSPIEGFKIEGVQQINLQQDEIPDLPGLSEAEKNVKLFNESNLFAHSPRLKVELEEVIIRIDDPPSKENVQRPPVALTMASSIVLFVMSGSTLVNTIVSFKNDRETIVYFIVELVVFGLMFVGSLLLPTLMEKWEKNQEAKREKLRQDKYTEYLTNKANGIAETIKKQEEVIKYNNISIEKIISNIIEHSSSIWDREVFDNDFLNIVVGIGNMPAKIKIDASGEKFELNSDNLQEYLQNIHNTKLELSNVPIAISIVDNVILPIVIEQDKERGYIKNIILQLIYHHSGKDLKIVVVTNEEKEISWEFMKCMSHNWANDYSRRFFATNEEELLEITTYLESEYNNRITADFEKNKNNTERYLIVSDDYSLLKNLQLLEKISIQENDVGFYGLIFSNSINNLPSRFNKMVEINNAGGMVIDRDVLVSEQIKFVPSIVKDINIEELSSILANIPVNIKGSSLAIPSSLGFLEMFNVGKIEQLNILSRWKENNPTTSLKTVVGVKENDRVLELDLHEKYHGPHGLIAGSTGSGKSEFIITFILSMAINYHPDEVQFVLIDYKGGGLAGAFENRETGLKLPHVVGTITNLDENEMSRTLVSINSELKRRQLLFNKTKEKLDESTIDIYKYQRLYREKKVDKPLSHLFIISDEFAELKAQQPDFMDELISTARIGRSLGIHLILATQKPSGVVDDQIWSNSRFRICLRVQTIDDSKEMIKRDEAAYIKDAGRFYLQVGNDEIFEMGQSGWTGAKYVPSEQIVKKVDDGIRFLSNTGEVIKEINEEVKKEEKEEYGEQLGNIVKFIYNIAEKENIKPPMLWLDSIPEDIYYNDLNKKYEFSTKPYFIEALIGEYDDPSHQNQGLVTLPLSTCGNIFIIGTSGSGKSTLLSTIIYSNIINHNSEELNVYIVDLGSEKLKLFKKAPQVGDVLTSDDSEKIKFLFYMLKEEKDRRFSYYSDNGGEFIKDVESGSAPFPTILVIINDIEVFKETFNDIYENDLPSLTRNCNKVGIVIVVSSTSASSLGYNLDSNFPKRVMLNMVDQSDYAYCFDHPPIPKRNPGRGLISIDDKPYEFQVAQIFERTIQDKNMAYVLNQLSLYLLKKAPKVPIVPEEIDFSTIKENITDISKVPLGINTQTAQMSYYNFSDLVTVMSSNSHVIVKKFFYRLAEILININNTKVIMINGLEDVNIDVPEGVKYFDAGFDKVFGVINNNVEKYKTMPKNETFVIIVIGYNGIVRYINEQTEEVSVSLEDLIVNSKELPNFKYVIYDTEYELSEFDQSEIDRFFKRKNGIWLGKDFDGQGIFELNKVYMDSTLNNTITIVSNGNTQNVKFN